MEQQYLNNFEIIQTNQMGIQNPGMGSEGDQQVKSNILSKQGKALSNGILRMDPIGRAKDRQTDHRRKFSEVPVSGDKDIQIIEDQSDLPYDKILDKKHKIKHNKKCSGCFKKHLNQDIIECSNCPKSFHRPCLALINLKITQPFFCESCQEVIKQKQIKKSIKKKTNLVKVCPIKKFTKFEEPNKGKPLIVEDSNPSIQKQLQQFADKYPLYIHNGRIQFPIQDCLFDEFPGLMKKTNNVPRPHPTRALPAYFGTVLEAWNTSQTFEEDFPEHKELSVWELSELLESKHNLIIVERLFIKFVQYLSRDIFTERFEGNREFINNPFLFLLRYCNETGLLDKILKYVWLEFLSQISKLSDFEVMVFLGLHSSIKKKLQQLLQNLRLKVNEQWLPSSLDDKVFILQCILNGIVETNSYHDDLSLKMQKGKQNSKLKQYAIEKVKQLEGELRDLADRKKRNERSSKAITKQINQQGDKQKLVLELEKLEKQHKQISLQETKLQQSLKVERQNVNSTSDGNVTFTNVEFLGKDKQRRDYWYVPNYRDKLFINTSDGWFEYDSLTINELIKSLNIKGVRQKQLLEKLQEYKRNNYFRPLDKNSQCKVQFYIQQQEQFQNNRLIYLQSNEIDFDREEFISFEFIKRILLLGEKKMSNYLDEKGARWGTADDREAYVNRIKTITTNRELIEAAKYLNDKVCVVQVEYNITDQEGQQNAETGKMRKVQTKLWGINEKYKHAWLQYLSTCNQNVLIQVFFLNAILYLTIDRYVSKMRVDNKRARKQFSDQAPSSVRSNRILNKQKPGQVVNGNKFEWEQTCNICHQFGELLCCDLCPKVFHLGCIGLSQIPEGSYQCKECESKRHTRSITKKIVDTNK